MNNPLKFTDPSGLHVVDCSWDGCPGSACPYCGGVGGGGSPNYGGDTPPPGASLTGPLWASEQQNEAEYEKWLAGWLYGPTKSTPADQTIIVHCNEFDLLDISCDPPPQAVVGSSTWYSPFYNADEARLASIGRGVVSGAGGIGDPRFIAGFYAASAGSVALDFAASSLEFLGPSGGFQYGQGRAFGVLWDDYTLLRLDLHPLEAGGDSIWHLHLFAAGGEHGLRIPFVWPF
jgi:hypothetical protein